MAYLRLDDFDKSVIEEISTFSGYSPIVVREVLESVFLRQVEQYMSNGSINIPFIGKLDVAYQGDDFVSGTRVAKVRSTLEESEVLKRIVGDVEDGESDILSNLMQSRIKAELQRKL